MWRPALGFEGIYEVSDDGDFRRLTTRSGLTRSEPKLLKTGKRRGYKNITFCKGGITSTHSAHRVVWEAFNGKIPDNMQINHKNGIKDDNRLDNLEVVTPSENTKHTFLVLGRKAQINPNPGSRNGRAKLSESDIPKIFALRESGMSQFAIANIFGIDQTTVSRILLKKAWAPAD